MYCTEYVCIIVHMLYSYDMITYGTTMIMKAAAIVKGTPPPTKLTGGTYDKGRVEKGAYKIVHISSFSDIISSYGQIH